VGEEVARRERKPNVVRYTKEKARRATMRSPTKPRALNFATGSARDGRKEPKKEGLEGLKTKTSCRGGLSERFQGGRERRKMTRK